MKKFALCFVILCLAVPVFAEKVDLDAPYTPTRYEWLDVVLCNHADSVSRLPAYKGSRVSTIVNAKFGKVWSTLYAPKNLSEKEVNQLKNLLTIGIYSVLGNYDWAGGLEVEVSAERE